MASFISLNKIPGESISESYALYFFLVEIKDPYFEMKVEIQNSKDDNTFIQSVTSIQKQDREDIYKGYIERKFSNKMRHVCEEDYRYLDKDCTFKIPRRKGDKYENFVVTSDHIRFKGKLLHVVQTVWK